MAAEIAAADGNEVFFLGDVDATGIVHQVEVVARGTADRVLVFLERAKPAGAPPQPSQWKSHPVARRFDGGQRGGAQPGNHQPALPEQGAPAGRDPALHRG